MGAGPDTFGGGKGANSAVAAARAGARVVMVGAVGDDAAGREQLALLAAAGVDTGAVRISATHATGVALIVVTPDGENSIVVGPGANHTLGAADLEGVLGRDAGDVVLAQAEVGVEATEAAAALARRGGARLVLSLAPVVAVRTETLAAADPLVVNAEEAADLIRLLGADPPAEPRDRAQTLVDAAGCASAVLTLGGDGAVVAGPLGVRLLPAPVVEVVDTTGAGDRLAGVLAAGLAAGLGLFEAAERAVAAAAESVRYAGARGGPDADPARVDAPRRRPGSC